MRYNIEVDNLELDMSDNYDIGWHSGDILSTDGNTLEELLDNAVVFCTDKDGDWSHEYKLGDLNTEAYLSLCDTILDYYLTSIGECDNLNYRQYLKQELI